MTDPQISINPPLRIGDQVPDFQARTTMGDVKFSDYRGRWLIFFSHPADFTPVCTTEFISLARRAESFANLNTDLLGLSVDSLNSHLAWVRAIRDQFGVDIAFPIVEDPSMAIGRAFGMIDENSIDSTAMRSSYFVDPQGVIRAITCYPHDVGRSVDEMLRLLEALQTVADGKKLAPEGWKPGDGLLAVPALQTSDMVNDPDWFCQKLDVR